MISIKNIRNFCIVAHIDHGKTTLSDRLLELTHTVEKREMKNQLLDSMDLERERGITIKSHPVAMNYRLPDGEEYLLNLIDTPGHVDFSYEVSRSLAACEGALLLVDASQGIEAQTVANASQAINQGLAVIPIINKIDLPGADIERTRQQLEDVLAIPGDEALEVSSKEGKGMQETLNAILKRVPEPRWASCEQTRILIFDSFYDPYKGVICYIRVFSGQITPGDRVLMMNLGSEAEIKEVGTFTPQMTSTETLGTGRVGYVVTNIKDVADVNLGDTMTGVINPAKKMLPGYKDVHPMVFSGIYPVDPGDFGKLKTSVGKLRLNDAAFGFQPETSVALGFGFRCGFLGLLHMEIVVERIRREYDLDIISTYPSVILQVRSHNGETIEVQNPINLPEAEKIDEIKEPMVQVSIHAPNKNIGDILNLIMEKRGICDRTETVDSSRVILNATLPLNEILVDFNDRLKSITRGYGSMDYRHAEYRSSDLVRLDIMVNGETVDAFSSIVHRKSAEEKGRVICEKLKDILPRQLFKVAIQAAIGGNVIARETLGSLRKDVTAKCYGGDITRKRKLLERQREGKKKMKQIGDVVIPQEAFMSLLKS
ncbi:MAG: elongation factor 4 [Rhodospirillaceae bacterium]|uniref:Elongation factor 4 n=1 Tax=Candidatus Moanibacter tarae TaxID=2200854 RepID=A0A2Z4AE15_9BACT|nr:MAG: Elongation factor 4 [Candidatus Moanabacter tarae]MBH66959.1 elongation factor 4 [Rhodospirillaceae bacterium]